MKLVSDRVSTASLERTERLLMEAKLTGKPVEIGIHYLHRLVDEILKRRKDDVELLGFRKPRRILDSPQEYVS